MYFSTLTATSQISVPKAIRDRLGLKAGDRIGWVEVEPGKFAIVPVCDTVLALKGIIQAPETPVTVDDMRQAIANQSSDPT